MVGFVVGVVNEVGRGGKREGEMPLWPNLAGSEEAPATAK